MTKANQIGLMILVVFLLSIAQVQAQIKPQNLRVGFLNETSSLPSAKLSRLPIHPTFNIGTDLRVRSGKHWQRTLGVDAYYYYHRKVEHAIMLDASYRIGYKFDFGLQLNLTTALGYKHAILAGKKYELQGGEYQSTTHWGKAQINTKLGFGLEYPISEKYSITTDYKVMLAAPSGDIFIPFSINTFLGTGLKIKIN